MTAKEFLERGEIVAGQLVAEKIHLETLQDEVNHMAAFRSSYPVHATKERTIEEAIRIAKRMAGEEIEAIRDLRQHQQEFVTAINTVPDPFQREVLRLHYIEGLPWEKVAEECHYSVKSIYRYLKKALEVIEIPEQYRTN